MKKMIFSIIAILAGLYILICIMLYFFQEKLIFFPQKLSNDHKFHFNQSFEEIPIITADGIHLNSVLFKADSSKGLIFYLHGNAGALDTWGEIAKTYTDLNYDLFMLDYRGYGKSEGVVNGQTDLFEDVQHGYNEIKARYNEESIIILGYSIGTGAAAKLASANKPRMLILQAPYYTFTDLVQRMYPFFPSFLLRYKFETAEYLKNCKAPVVIFHGDHDEVIYYGSSLKLEKQFKSTDKLITLKGQGHNGITENEQYTKHIKEILR
ncbi:MAG: alpha/beta fold hydrolase [Flavitalea sp.]